MQILKSLVSLLAACSKKQRSETASVGDGLALNSLSSIDSVQTSVPDSVLAIYGGSAETFLYVESAKCHSAAVLRKYLAAFDTTQLDHALSRAAIGNCVENARLFVKKGAGKTFDSEAIDTIFILATIFNSPEMLGFLLRRFPRGSMSLAADLPGICRFKCARTIADFMDFREELMEHVKMLCAELSKDANYDDIYCFRFEVRMLLNSNDALSEHQQRDILDSLVENEQLEQIAVFSDSINAVDRSPHFKLSPMYPDSVLTMLFARGVTMENRQEKVMGHYEWLKLCVSQGVPEKFNLLSKYDPSYSHVELLKFLLRHLDNYSSFAEDFLEKSVTYRDFRTMTDILIHDVANRVTSSDTCLKWMLESFKTGSFGAFRVLLALADFYVDRLLFLELASQSLASAFKIKRDKWDSASIGYIQDVILQLISKRPMLAIGQVLLVTDKYNLRWPQLTMGNDGEEMKSPVERAPTFNELTGYNALRTPFLKLSKIPFESNLRPLRTIKKD